MHKPLYRLMIDRWIQLSDFQINTSISVSSLMGIENIGDIIHYIIIFEITVLFVFPIIVVRTADMIRQLCTGIYRLDDISNNYFFFSLFSLSVTKASNFFMNSFSINSLKFCSRRSLLSFSSSSIVFFFGMSSSLPYNDIISIFFIFFNPSKEKTIGRQP